MAIKTVSQLDLYDNNIGHQTATDQFTFDGTLHLFNSHLAYDYNIDGDSARSLTYCNTTYNQALFEISKPSHPGDSGKRGTETAYTSYNITYEDLAKNIIFDTKVFLNRKNRLDNFNLNNIVNGNYTFNGNKTFSGSIECNGLTSNNSVVFGKSDDSTKSFICRYPATFTQTLTIKGTTIIQGDFNCQHLTATDIYSTGDITAKEKVNAQGELQAASILTCNNTGLTCTIPATTGKIQFTNILTANTVSDTQTCGFHIHPSTHIDNNLTVDGNTNIGGNTDIGGDTKIGGKIDVQTCESTFRGPIYIKNDKGSDENNGTIIAGDCTLTALHARWSDLAEYYIADDKYEPGTLVKFGGKNEITIADDNVNAVVTSKPAVIMNSGIIENENSCAIALVGRVPVKVYGKVKKFDKLVLWKNGIARKQTFLDRLLCKKTIGQVLDIKTSVEIQTIEAIVKLTI